MSQARSSSLTVSVSRGAHQEPLALLDQGCLLRDGLQQPDGEQCAPSRRSFQGARRALFPSTGMKSSEIKAETQAKGDNAQSLSKNGTFKGRLPLFFMWNECPLLKGNSQGV